MYDLVDRPVEQLDNSGRFLLWAMRGWADAIKRRDCAPRALRRGFAAMQALPALPDFHLVMALLNQDARATIALAPIGCARVSEDEAVLLALWREAAQWRPERAQDTLILLVGTGSVVAIATAIGAATRAFTAAGIDFTDISRSFPNRQESPRS